MSRLYSKNQKILTTSKARPNESGGTFIRKSEISSFAIIFDEYIKSCIAHPQLLDDLEFAEVLLLFENIQRFKNVKKQLQYSKNTTECLKTT